MFKKGTIILLPFPFTDLSASKIRPALIVSSDIIAGDDIVVVFISSRKPKRVQATDIIIKHSDESFAMTGLKTDSVIRVNRIATLDRKIILGELGEISKETQKQVNKRFKILLDL